MHGLKGYSMKRVLMLVITLAITTLSIAKDKEVRIVATSDIHGCFLPYDFINDKPMGGSMARVETYLKGQRELYGDNLIYVDIGDILQGQPSAYYYNTHPEVKHFASEILNYMGCSIAVLGNHDIETGTDVFERYIREGNFTTLGANILRDETDENYVAPYKIIEKGGIKIAFIGMITPTISSWLPKMLWRNIHFVDMVECSKKWVDYVQKNEHPDVIIGLFHAGEKGGIETEEFSENPTEQIAREVPGFDAIMFGHDHKMNNKKVTNIIGKEVTIINPANQAKYVTALSVKMADDKVTIVPEVISMKNLEPDKEFMQHFSGQMQTVKEYVAERIGTISKTITSKDALDGPSEFIDLIHKLQLELTGADISITAPLSLYAEIDSGDIYVRDMFKLYKYENMLYTMQLTGEEIKNHLEMSYDLWINRQDAPFNYDSAAGIIYEVDKTEPKGNRIRIISMADGTPFVLEKQYKVAINSYRGNGGGELLTKGAGIAKEELNKRILTSTDKDLRYYLMNYIKENGTITPTILNQWKFVGKE